ncbi:MAG: uncharacterized protein QG657_3822 [Acidobacteriota bacterium]|nr:uncharacterized protein [Acidobacteriota bacterium]
MKIINHIPPVMPGIFTLPPYDDEPPALLGGFCPVCNAYYFPRPKYCRACLGPLKETRVGSEGSIYSFTIVRKKAPLGLPQPYGVGYVILKETGLFIFSLFDPATLDKLRIGLPVRLAVNTLGVDINGSPCLRPYFTPMPVMSDPGKI